MASIRDNLIPTTPGNAVDLGWPSATGSKPRGVTWHWTALATLAEADRYLGGSAPLPKRQASAHYCVGRTASEGVLRWVSLENRSWHAGAFQTLRWDGETMSRADYKASRTTVGVETVNLGYARAGVPASADWTTAATPEGESYQIQPWPAEQLSMCVEVGRLIQQRWPHLTYRDHHGHHDLCPQYKEDVSGFPFAPVLRGIYGDVTIPDVWSTLWTIKQRQSALIKLGYNLGYSGADGVWGPKSLGALKSFQSRYGISANGFWTSFVNWKMYEVAKARGLGWPIS